MANSNYSDRLLQMLQKPDEIFAGVMPLGRELFAPRIYLRRCKKIDAPELRMGTIRTFIKCLGS